MKYDPKIFVVHLNSIFEWVLNFFNIIFYSIKNRKAMYIGANISLSLPTRAQFYAIRIEARRKIEEDLQQNIINLCQAANGDRHRTDNSNTKAFYKKHKQLLEKLIQNTQDFDPIFYQEALYNFYLSQQFRKTTSYHGFQNQDLVFVLVTANIIIIRDHLSIGNQFDDTSPKTYRSNSNFANLVFAIKWPQWKELLDCTIKYTKASGYVPEEADRVFRIQIDNRFYWIACNQCSASTRKSGIENENGILTWSDFIDISQNQRDTFHVSHRSPLSIEEPQIHTPSLVEKLDNIDDDDSLFFPFPSLF